MNVRARLSVMAFGCVVLGAAAQGSDLRNVTTGGALRPGVYGRIEVRGNTAPPPVIYPEPVLANSSIERAHPRRPVYLYVPPGQVRHWKQNCAKWAACDDPVLFVRMDRSPSRWGEWRQHREQLAWDPLNHPH